MLCEAYRYAVINGIYKNGKHINPYASNKFCEINLSQNLIYGCGKPFRVILDDNQYKAIVCDYDEKQ